MGEKATAHVNGWNIISVWLDDTGRRQKDLAAALEISEPAITQIKRGKYLLSGRQIRRLLNFFQADESKISAFYREIVRARFFADQSLPDHIDDDWNHVPQTCPVIRLGDLATFDPVRSTLADFAREHAVARLSSPCVTKSGTSLILLEGNIEPERRILLADGNRRARHGEFVVACGYDGKFSVGLFFSEPERYGITCKLPGMANYMSRLHNPPALFRWAFPLSPIPRREAIDLFVACRKCAKGTLTQSIG
ncbi:MAG: helix-turn-helix transcriptional regulator [Victivallaceae bacterium]|nr:helix-turn-helix transcriptional regulator [Victivallaceae bacterium]